MRNSKTSKTVSTLSCLLLALLLVISCSTGGANTDKAGMNATRQALISGDSTQAVESLRAKQDDYTDKNLFTLDFGMVNLYAGDYALACKALSAAETAIEESQTKSISQGLTRVVTNDNAVDYVGEKYEDVFINGFSALSYYMDGSLQDAMVEIRRAETKLRDFGMNEDEESGMTKALFKLTPNPYEHLGGHQQAQLRGLHVIRLHQLSQHDILCCIGERR